MPKLVKAKLPDSLDISSLLGKCRNRIYRIGIELEGGWRVLPKGTSSVERDGSVDFTRDFPMEQKVIPDKVGGPGRLTMHYPKGEPPKYPGELPSPQLALDQWEKWLVQHFPQEVNSTCGMHVHMSFRSALMYQRLMDPRYQSTVIEYLSRWAKSKGSDTFPENHHIWSRLDGSNEFCQHVYQADEQAQTQRKDYDHFRKGHRYSFIHYPFSRHGTIECRGLPMMSTSELSIEAIKELFSITSAFLVATYRAETPLDASWVATDTIISESTIENV